MLGADVGVIKKTGFFLGKNYYPSGPVSKAFEQVDHLVIGIR